MTKKQMKILMIIAILLILFFLIVNVFHIQDIFLKKIYPMKYADQVYRQAEVNKIDPLLVFAIIKAESNFDEEAVSKTEAIGLMQLMNATAEETAKKLKMTYRKEDLYDPEKNIILGTKYFSTLLEKYENVTIALTAYNAGSGNVDKWIENGTIKKEGTDVENIPYKETNNYVRKILRDYTIYQKLYKE